MIFVLLGISTTAIVLLAVILELEAKLNEPRN